MQTSDHKQFFRYPLALRGRRSNSFSLALERLHEWPVLCMNIAGAVIQSLAQDIHPHRHIPPTQLARIATHTALVGTPGRICRRAIASVQRICGLESKLLRQVATNSTPAPDTYGDHGCPNLRYLSPPPTWSQLAFPLYGHHKFDRTPHNARHRTLDRRVKPVLHPVLDVPVGGVQCDRVILQ